MRSGFGVCCVEKVPLGFLLPFRGETRIRTDGCSFGGCRPPSRSLRNRSRTPVWWSPLLLFLRSRLCSLYDSFAYFTKAFMSEMATTSRPRDSICSFSWGAILPAHTHTITHSCHYTTTEQQQKTTQTKQEHRQNNNTHILPNDILIKFCIKWQRDNATRLCFLSLCLHSSTEESRPW